MAHAISLCNDVGWCVTGKLEMKQIEVKMSFVAVVKNSPKLCCKKVLSD